MNRPIDVAVVGGAATLGFLFFGRYLWLVQRSRSWPTAEGRVTDTQVESTADHESGRLRRRVIVRYSFSVDGKPFTSDRVTYFEANMRHRTETRADLQRERYPIGGPVTVRYDPANPSNAVLDAGVDSSVPRAFYAATAFFGFGVLMSLLMVVRLTMGR